MGSARLPGLDAARALAVGLVIAVHALLPFMETPVGWAIRDRPRHVLVDLTVWVARSFVIPSLFWLSGFFARGAVQRRGLGDFVRQRIIRVGLPLLLLAWPNSLALGALWDLGRALQPRPAVAAQLPQLRGTGLAISLGHLWFLYYLLLVSAGAVVVVRVARAVNRVRVPVRVPAPWGPLAVALPLSGLLWWAGKLQLDTPLSFAIDPVIGLWCGLFFAWGWAAHAWPEHLDALARGRWSWLALALPLLAVIVPSLRASVAAPAPSVGGAALLASAAFSTLTTAAFIGFCLRQVTRSRPTGAGDRQFLARASYFCYLVHLPLLVALQIALLRWTGPGALKCAGALACTVGVCLAGYAGWAAIGRAVTSRAAR